MRWRDQMNKSARVVHDTFADPVTVHFADHDLKTTARSNREGAVVGQDGYAQALVSSEQLVFMLEDLHGHKLERGLTVTAAGGVAVIDEVYPPDLSRIRCDIHYL